MERGAKEKNQHLYKPYSNGETLKRSLQPTSYLQHYHNPAFFPPQGLLLKNQCPSNRRSRKWGVTVLSLSLTCLISSISAGEVWRASSMTRWPSASPQRSWSPGTCWPEATTTSTTSAPGSRRSGEWECSSDMGFYCHSGERKIYGCCMNALWMDIVSDSSGF